MSRISKTAVATLALTLFAAPLAFAGEVITVDEWNQPVMVQGAKGAPVRATQAGQFTTGVAASTTKGGDIKEVLQGSQAWTPQASHLSQAPQNGSDWMNR